MSDAIDPKPSTTPQRKLPHVVQKRAWSDTAKLIVQETRPHLRHHSGLFYDWDGSRYVVVDEATMKSEARWFLASCAVKIHTKDGFKHEPFNPSNRDVSELVGAMKDHLHLPHSHVPFNSWLPWHTGPTPPPEECINFPNCILHIPTDDQYQPTPNFFTCNVSMQSWSSGSGQYCFNVLSHNAGSGASSA